MKPRRILGADEAGAALTEFGLLIPVLLILLVGAFDMGHRLYARAVLEGAVQKAARDAGLEDGTVATRQAAIDEKVRGQARRITNRATVTFTRRAYRTFTRAAARGEPWIDSNNDKLCNANENYDDINRNSRRDAEIGVVGQGGAQDAVIYSARMVYPPITPVPGLFGLTGDVDLTATTVMRNQPYNDQGSDLAPLPGKCP